MSLFLYILCSHHRSLIFPHFGCSIFGFFFGVFWFFGWCVSCDNNVLFTDKIQICAFKRCDLSLFYAQFIFRWFGFFFSMPGYHFPESSTGIGYFSRLHWFLQLCQPIDLIGLNGHVFMMSVQCSIVLVKWNDTSLFCVWFE